MKKMTELISDTCGVHHMY